MNEDSTDRVELCAVLEKLIAGGDAEKLPMEIRKLARKWSAKAPKQQMDEKDHE